MPPSNLLLASKIVVLEEPPQIRNIPGAPTAIMAFLGVTERGPLRTPVFLTSFEEYVEEFGGFIANSDLPLAMQGFFLNGGTAAWVSRTNHYTDINDPASATAAKGSLTIPDRGGVAGPAILDATPGPYALLPGQVLEVNIDAAGADTLTFTSTQALAVTINTTPFSLVNGDTIVYRVTDKTTGVLGLLRTITLTDADPLIGAIGATTAQELVNFINRDGIGISAEITGGGTTVTIKSDAQGSGASLVIDASSTAISGGKLDIPSGTSNGTGNVALIDAVTAAEIVGLLTGLPLSAGVASTFTTTTTNDTLRLTSTATGDPGGSVVITASTTATGIFVGALPITQPGTNSAESPALGVEAKTEGNWIASPSLYSVEIEAPSGGDSDRFNLRVLKAGAAQEIYPNLSMVVTDERYAEDFVNERSNLIVLTDLFSPATPPANRPKLGSFSSWAGQDDGLVGLVDIDFTGTEAGATGLFAFDDVQNITVLLVPGRATSAVHNAMISYCEVQRAKTCFAILDPPEGLDEQGIKTYVESTAAIGGLTEFAAIYWPRVEILNPSTAVFGAAERLIVPPSGHIAGVYTRTDASTPGGVFVPPAGVETGILFGVLGFETDDVLDERKRDVVFPARINPLVAFDGTPRHIDGARTLKGNGSFPSVSERRGVIFIEVSLKQGLLFAKHMNNDRRLRMQVQRTIQAFLLRQFANKAFRGNTPSESFTVDVSDKLNTEERILAGELHVRVGVATQRPAEFIVLVFTQDTRALDERLQAELG